MRLAGPLAQRPNAQRSGGTGIFAALTASRTVRLAWRGVDAHRRVWLALHMIAVAVERMGEALNVGELHAHRPRDRTPVGLRRHG